MDQYSWDRVWEALAAALRPVWKEDFERNASRALQVYQRLPAGLQHQLINAPPSVQLAVANGFSRAGTVGALPVEDLILATEQEVVRLKSGGRWLNARLAQSISEAAAGLANLEVKDSRSVTGSEQELQAAFGTTPSGWRRLTVVQSQSTFT